VDLYRYCQCFAARAVCSPSCHCIQCANTDSPDNAEIRAEAIKSIIQRNPHAFDSKFKAVRGVLMLPSGAHIAYGYC
jgi:hypothetical protein